MQSDKVPLDDELRNILKSAFTAAENWDGLVAEIRRRPNLLHTKNWLNRIET